MAIKKTTMWRKIRIEKGLTIQQVAYDLKVSEKCISKLYDKKLKNKKEE